MTISQCLLLLALVLLVVLSFTFLQLPVNSLFWNALQNSGHAIVFGALSLISMNLQMRSNKRSVLTVALYTAISLSALGLVIELAQQITGRGVDVRDIAFNTAGIISGCCLYSFAISVLRSRPHCVTAVLLLVTGSAATAWAMHRPAIYLVAGAQRPSVPVLANFENPGARYFIDNNGAGFEVGQHAAWIENLSHSLKVDYQPGRWPKIQFLEPAPDWTAYSRIMFNVFNPSERVISLSIRIDDSTLGLLENDHMTVRQMVPTGNSKVSLDLDLFRDDALHRGRPGQATFKEIQSFMVILGGNEVLTTLYFDDFILQ